MSARVIPDSVRALQIQASQPTVSAFVAANAGSGKTHVLAQRVIRVLLDGVDPAKILCITFTKAAAANMAKRVFDTLGGWIALDDAALDRALAAIGVGDVGAGGRARARRLFASALEVPGGLKVQTIHAFCTRLLQQFPFEANVAARFAVLDDRAEAELLDRASLGVLLDAATEPESALGRALSAAITAAADQTFRDVVAEAIRCRDTITQWMARAGGLGQALDELSQALGVTANDSIANIETAIVEGPLLASRQWPQAAADLASGSANDCRQADRLTSAIKSNGAFRLEKYLSVFFSNDGGARKSLTTNAVAQRHAGLARQLGEEQVRLMALLERRRAVTARDRTACLLTIAVEVIKRYRVEKDRRGVLDYDDLIDKTLSMLRTVNPTWVHYKLDLGIDHVLIDEAQDTSPKQWEIVARLAGEFTAGAGARTLTRTIFAVGDEKQSIFSFQGAVPRQFDEMQRTFAGRFAAAERPWLSLRLQHSFRSGANILAAVDTVFSEKAVFASVTSDISGIPPHLALPETAPGLVEVWPLVSAENRRELEAWDAPFDELAESSPQVRLAERIARNVAALTAAGTRAGDVLVLVRQRGSLFEAIIRTLKARGVPVAGADRLILTEHIAVIDLMALTDALLLPEDDLALAVALKSPLFGFDDDMLFELAFERPATLRAALHDKATTNAAFADAAARLDRCAATARVRTPFAFFAWLLGAEGGRARVLARLGPEAIDALDEFLELALDYEQRETATLQGFVAWLRAADTEIKRDMEMSRDEVRVMTVHGAKGLEAPIVILADTTTRPSGPRSPRLLTLPGERIVWAAASAADTPIIAEARRHALAAAEDEYRRLLYVAMTRAAQRLIICGTEGVSKRPDGCWYDLVVKALTLTPDCIEGPADDGDGVVWRYRPVPQPAVSALGGKEAPRRPVALPDWLRRPVAAAPIPDAVLAPSLAVDDEPQRSVGTEAALSPVDARVRGIVLHRLMQALPEIAPSERPEAARRYLLRSDQDLAETATLLAQILAILNDQRFASLFAPGSRAEVPIVGRLRRHDGTTLAVSGQVDRLAVTRDAVWIADYKTTRSPPRRLEDVPRAYVTQLAIYRAVLAKAYPNRLIRAALVWTDVPDLMELSAGALDTALGTLQAA